MYHSVTPSTRSNASYSISIHLVFSRLWFGLFCPFLASLGLLMAFGGSKPHLIVTYFFCIFSTVVGLKKVSSVPMQRKNAHESWSVLKIANKHIILMKYHLKVERDNYAILITKNPHIRKSKKWIKERLQDNHRIFCLIFLKERYFIISNEQPINAG